MALCYHDDLGNNYNDDTVCIFLKIVEWQVEEERK